MSFDSKKEPIRVMHVIDSLSPGGAERVLIDLVKGLHDKGIDVSVCVTRQNYQLAKELPRNVDLLILNRNRTWDWLAIIQLVKSCKQKKITILHPHGRSSFRLCSVVKFLNFGKPIIVFHDHYGEIHVNKKITPFFKWIVKSFADFYIGVDQALVSWAIDCVGVDPNRTITLRNAIDQNRFKKKPTTEFALNPKRKLLRAAVVANLKPQKNHPLLFLALSRSIIARQKLELFLIGTDLDDDYSHYCHKLVADLGLNDRVHFLGSRNDIPQILQEVDFGLLSSRSETGPLILLEYMASRLPFLVTDTGQVAKFVNQQGVPFFVETEDIQGYAIALDQMVSLSNLERKQLGEKNLEIVEKYFTLGSNVNSLISLYTQLVNEKTII